MTTAAPKLAKMKLLALTFTLLVTVVGLARAVETDVAITLTDSRLSVAGLATNRTVQVQRLSVPDMVNGQVVIGGKLTFVTDTNGSCVFSNAAAGLYTVTVLAPPARTDFQFLVLATNLGPINAGDNLVAAAGATFPAGAVAWAAAVTDSRYSRTTNSLTNYVTFSVLTGTNNILQAEIGVNVTNILSTSNTLQATITTAGTAITNYILANGVLATNLSLLVGANDTNFTKTVGTSLTNLINSSANGASNLALLVGANDTNFSRGVGTALTNYVGVQTNIIFGWLGTAAFSNSSQFQTASANLTKWAAHVTNDYYPTNLNLQAGSAVLTNLDGFGTNFWYPRANPSNFVDATVTNKLASTNYADTVVTRNIVPGSNIAFVTNGNALTISATLPSGTGSGIVVLNGLNTTNQTFSTGTSGSAFNIVSSGTNHTFNIPYVATNKDGLVSSNDWTKFNSSQVGSVNLTNWSAHVTNDYTSTNVFVTYTNVAYGLISTNTVGLAGLVVTNTFNMLATNGSAYGANLSNTVWRGPLLPAANATYDLASSSTAARDIFLSRNLKFTGLGTVAFTGGQDGAVTFNAGGSEKFYVSNVTSTLKPLTILSDDSLTIGAVGKAQYPTGGTNEIVNVAYGTATYYPRTTNPSNFVTQTIYATNNPSNIVVTLPSLAFWTNGDQWVCATGSNWLKTVQH